MQQCGSKIIDKDDAQGSEAYAGGDGREGAAASKAVGYLREHHGPQQRAERLQCVEGGHLWLVERQGLRHVRAQEVLRVPAECVEHIRNHDRHEHQPAVRGRQVVGTARRRRHVAGARTVLMRATASKPIWFRSCSKIEGQSPLYARSVLRMQSLRR